MGPSYPVGPKLRVQVLLSYNSRSTDYGAPSAGEQNGVFSYKPMAGNPALGTGWELALGAIKNCKHGAIVGSCYFSADGSQHMFGSGPRASDASQLYLSGSGPYQMWDGDGNHYVFGWHVVGYDDIGLPEGFTHDFGRGRDGWYLTSVTDPFGNGYTISYYDRAAVTTPLWTYGSSSCSAHVTTLMQMRNPSATNTWIPKDITLPSGSRIHFNTGPVLGVSGMITSLDFPEFVDGAAATRTWTLGYEGAFATLGHGCGTSGNVPVNVLRLKSVTLPTDDAGSAPSYQVSSLAQYGQVLLDRITLPTGGAIQYCYSMYTFFHGRGGKLEPGCPGLAPPAGDADTVVTESLSCAAAVVEDPAPEIPGGCTTTNSSRWIDHQPGVVRRREIVGSSQEDTDYKQFAFPFGESGDASSPGDSETLTISVFPGTDRNGDAGRSRAKAVLFRSTRGVLANGSESGSVPGDMVGAELEERVFETDPTVGGLQDPPCGGGTDSPFCASRAVRVVQKTWEVDTAGLPGSNRRLQNERTTFGALGCATCPYHQVAFSLTSGDSWDGNGRHYNVETHTGSLGGDAKSTTTDWDPVNWLSGPPPGQPVLPNVIRQRTTSQGASTRDQYFEYDTTTPTGFLKGEFVYDSARDIAFIRCLYNDGAGNVDKEFTRTLNTASAPARTYCSANYPTFPASAGIDGDLFGKDYTWQHGELLSARWINGTAGTPTFKYRDLTRDATTGRVASSRDTAGLQTTYTYDSLGRARKITPPSAGELPTFVCYEGPTATTAYRASAKQACPVASSNPGIATWQHFEYDGLARLVRQKRLQPGNSVVKQFTLFDGAGNGIFTSEWVPDATAETLTRDLSTTCVFSGGVFGGRARPSSAPGTFRMCYDPFGRPQQVVGARMSSFATIDRNDAGGNAYSDTREAVLTYCVNASFANLQTPTCAANGINATTTTQKDAFGRITSVTEPTGEITTSTYDVNGKLTGVSQGAQSRSFNYDANGFLRAESTPERGTVSYTSIGSLGNVRAEAQPGSLVILRTYDFAGRLTEEDAPAGSKTLVNCYDGAASCVDGSPGFPGGPYPGGKLTRRYGYNWIPTTGPIVDEQFSYADGGGRLSKLATNAGNGDLSLSASQAWTYGPLGLATLHEHPRASGSFPVSKTYTNGLPTAAVAGGSAVVTAATYNPSAGLASWTAGTLGAGIVTTIAQDATMLPRPASISNSLWSSGAYVYDGAANVLKMGTSDAFSYDSRSRLLSAKYGSTTRAFGYDRYGNLTQNGAAIAIDPATNHVTSGSAAYDARGDMIAYGGDTMSYDAIDRQYRNSNGSSDWVFLFNGAGERVARFPAKSPVLRREMARYIAEANVAAKGWTLPACVQVFTDVPCSDPDARQIKLAYDKNVTGGCSTNPLQYCPDGTLTRAQMAVFLVKGYKPDGFAPPPCQGTFSDVSCSGAYGAFAPWIEQLYRDGVTGGCSASPLQFCPGNTVGEWEMLVWLAKAPGASPSTPFWTAYHPVPRGTIYTLRDDQNRIVTEMAGGPGGSSTATLSVTRDNVFFGDLLVASYVAAPAGWQYTVSDHLGSPRAVFNQSGQLVESHKHWPYGEDTNAAPPTQHLAYALMEKEDGAARYYDHARTHDHGLGRFLSPDRLGGGPANPQSWNRYAYTLGNPMKYVDPDGHAVANFTGLGNSADSAVHALARYFGTQSLGESRVFRHQDVAAAAAFLIQQHAFHPDQPVVIAGHSRGAAASLQLARTLQKAGIHVDLLLTIDPVLIDYRLSQTVPSNVRLAVNFWETESSPLQGTYLTADAASTDIENRRVAGVPHGRMDDEVAANTGALDQIVASMWRRIEEDRRKKENEPGCRQPDHECTK